MSVNVKQPQVGERYFRDLANGKQSRREIVKREGNNIYWADWEKESAGGSLWISSWQNWVRGARLLPDRYIRIRIAVAVDSEGQYAAAGDSAGLEGDWDRFDYVLDGLGRDVTRTWVTASVRIPSIDLREGQECLQNEESRQKDTST